MSVSDFTTKNPILTKWLWIEPKQPSSTPTQPPQPKKRFDLLKPIKRWIDGIEVHNPQLAHLICHLIPAQCPFERDINLFGHTLFHIPPLCKLNPFYDEVVGLRFRALCYLADECGEDISAYC
ncbi:Mo-dependent nitrogenase C-terminal domain-containing protein [Coleofasciculus sp. E1-EBD-02]|uniref:Mo-dependent nitrogenase C-terminal domain-containing protein n=1 Tax=Coleofasciculus sp. E1-EBD-02 TaxID=3068481 RepID=UPI0032F2F468